MKNKQTNKQTSKNNQKINFRLAELFQWTTVKIKREK